MLECRETNRQPSELLAVSRSETVSLPAPPLSSRAERPSYWSAPPAFWSLLRIAVLRAYTLCIFILFASWVERSSIVPKSISSAVACARSRKTLIPVRPPVAACASWRHTRSTISRTQSSRSSLIRMPSSMPLSMTLGGQRHLPTLSSTILDSLPARLLLHHLKVAVSRSNQSRHRTNSPSICYGTTAVHPPLLHR